MHAFALIFLVYRHEWFTQGAALFVQYEYRKPLRTLQLLVLSKLFSSATKWIVPTLSPSLLSEAPYFVNLSSNDCFGNVLKDYAMIRSEWGRTNVGSKATWILPEARTGVMQENGLMSGRNPPDKAASTDCLDANDCWQPKGSLSHDKRYKLTGVHAKHNNPYNRIRLALTRWCANACEIVSILSEDPAVVLAPPQAHIVAIMQRATDSVYNEWLWNEGVPLSSLNSLFERKELDENKKAICEKS